MRWMILGMLALTLGSCASATPGEIEARRAELLKDARVGEPVKEICFTRQIDRFRGNGRDSVVLTRAANDEYLVIIRGCPLLDSALGISLSGRGCLQDQGDLFVSDTIGPPLSGVPQRVDRCPVHAIYRWDEEADEEKE